MLELRANAFQRKFKKQDFILKYALKMEDKGEDAEFIPITVLSSDYNVVQGGPRRYVDITARYEEGSMAESRV